jgi:hypothetical protein
MYLRGTLKRVTTGFGAGGEEGRTIGGSTRLASILNEIDEAADIMKVFEVRFHCPKNRKGAMSDEPTNILSCFESDMREQVQMHGALRIRRERSSKLLLQTDAAGPWWVSSLFFPRPKTAPRHSSIPTPTYARSQQCEIVTRVVEP